MANKKHYPVLIVIILNTEMNLYVIKIITCKNRKLVSYKMTFAVDITSVGQIVVNKQTVFAK